MICKPELWNDNAPSAIRCELLQLSDEFVAFRRRRGTGIPGTELLPGCSSNDCDGVGQLFDENWD